MNIRENADRVLTIILDVVVVAMLLWSLLVSQQRISRLEQQAAGLERSLATATSLGCNTEDNTDE